MQTQVHELEKLAGFVETVFMQEGLSWEDRYSLIFSPHCSRRIFALFSELNLGFDYYDPDAGYEDDVVAFHTALKSRLAELQPILNQMSLTRITFAEGSPDLRSAQNFSGNLGMSVAASIKVPAGLAEDEARAFVQAQLSRAAEAAPALSFSVVLGEPSI